MTKELEISVLKEATLQPRHFDGLGMSARQLHLWLKQTGWADGEREGRKWRLFSPLELLSLASLRTLKVETDLSLSKHPDFIKFIGNPISFAVPVLTLWQAGNVPLLKTDLREMHQVVNQDENAPGCKIEVDHFVHAVLVVTMPLLEPIAQMIEAIKAGGSENQRKLLHASMDTPKAYLKTEDINSARISPYKRGKRIIRI